MDVLTKIEVVIRIFFFIGFFIVLLDFVNEESYLRPLLIDLSYIIVGIILTPILMIQDLLIYIQSVVDPNLPPNELGLIEIFQKYIQLFLLGILMLLGWVAGRSPDLFVMILEAPFNTFQFIFGAIIIDLHQQISETGAGIYLDLWDLFFSGNISIGIPGLKLEVDIGISIFQHEQYGFFSAFANLDLEVTLIDINPNFTFNIWDEITGIFQLENYGFPTPYEWFQEVLANA